MLISKPLKYSKILEKKDINEKLPVMKMEIVTFITVCKKFSANNFFSVRIFAIFLRMRNQHRIRVCYIYTESLQILIFLSLFSTFCIQHKKRKTYFINVF